MRISGAAAAARALVNVPPVSRSDGYKHPATKYTQIRNRKPPVTRLIQKNRQTTPQKARVKSLILKHLNKLSKRREREKGREGHKDDPHYQVTTPEKEKKHSVFILKRGEKKTLRI